MEEIFKEYAQAILSAAGGILILGILAAVFLGENSQFPQMMGNFISGSF